MNGRRRLAVVKTANRPSFSFFYQLVSFHDTLFIQVESQTCVSELDCACKLKQPAAGTSILLECTRSEVAK